MLLFEIYYVLYRFAIGGRQLGVDIDNLGALCTLGLYLGGNRDGEVAVVGHIFQDALELASVAGEHLDFVADVLEVLAAHLEGGCETGRADLEFVVLDVAVKGGFDFARDAGAGVYVDTLGRVDFNRYFVFGRYAHVDEKNVSSGDGVLYCLGQLILVNHNYVYNKEEAGRGPLQRIEVDAKLRNSVPKCNSFIIINENNRNIIRLININYC